MKRKKEKEEDSRRQKLMIDLALKFLKNVVDRKTGSWKYVPQAGSAKKKVAIQPEKLTVIESL